MRFLLWALLIYLVYRMVRGSAGRAAPKLAKESAGAETFRDPVCGVYVSEADAVVGKLEGKRIHFCSMKCLEQFQKMQQQR